MDDDVLASLVAMDLQQNLRDRAASVCDVYGVCLWVDDVYGSFLASFATEAWFERQRRLPEYASAPDRALSAPVGPRWSLADWYRFPDDDFVTPATRAALQPLISRLTDDTLPDDVLEAESARCRELAFIALELARPLDVLPCTDDAIAFVAFTEMTLEEQVQVMRRTVPPDRFQAVFPGWRDSGDR
jgi:hypothetical protein